MDVLSGPPKQDGDLEGPIIGHRATGMLHPRSTEHRNDQLVSSGSFREIAETASESSTRRRTLTPLPGPSMASAMMEIESILAFVIVAALLTITPGLDTALVLRTAAVEGVRHAGFAAMGIAAGCLAWGVAVALGVGALSLTSPAAFTALKWIGAAYLFWLGAKLLVRPRQLFDLGGNDHSPASATAWMRRGFLTNILNPKVGVFYVSFLPQFLAPGVPPSAFLLMLAAIHASLGCLWFALLIAATKPLSRHLRKAGVVAWLDRITGGIFVAFGLRLAWAQ